MPHAETADSVCIGRLDATRVESSRVEQPNENFTVPADTTPAFRAFFDAVAPPTLNLGT